MIKDISRVLISLIFICIGILHFIITEKFILIVPPIIPYEKEVIYISGIFEILGGVGILIPKLKRQAAFGLILLLITVFPANIYMALYNIQLGGILNNSILQWLRLPLQAVFIWWVYWCSRD
jgi:uncharacterized membrane protein